MSSTTTAARSGGPSGTAAGRLPVPTRDRRPALAALAVLLILGGALVSGLIVLRSGQRSDLLIVRRDVAPGQVITDADLGVARLAGTGAHAVSADARPQIVGTFATARLFAGTLLSRQMVQAEPSVPVGSAVVGLTLTANQAPAGGVAQGAVVRVLVVPARGGTGEAVVLVQAARVTSGARASSADEARDLSRGNGTSISVLVPQDVAPAVAAASAQGEAAVVQLPPGTTPTVG